MHRGAQANRGVECPSICLCLLGSPWLVSDYAFSAGMWLKSSVSFIKKHIISLGLLGRDGNFDHLVKVVFFDFLQAKDIFDNFLISK